MVASKLIFRDALVPVLPHGTQGEPSDVWRWSKLVGHANADFSR